MCPALWACPELRGGSDDDSLAHAPRGAMLL